MNIELQIYGLSKLGKFINEFFAKEVDEFNERENEFHLLLKKSQMENAWFTPESLKSALLEWANAFDEDKIKAWLSHYSPVNEQKTVGLILAGNIPLVGWHDVMSVILSGHTAMIKLSSKDKNIIPFLLKLWNEYSENNIDYQLVEKLENFDAVIATGSNNTARYLNYYFEKYPHIIRKNRTSIGVLDGTETDEEIQKLAQDIFTYYGLGCRNISRLFLPKDFKLDQLFENFMEFSEIINHNSYANNYDYNKAIYLLNQEQFWDNNFVMLKEDEQLFSPLSVINFTHYNDMEEVKNFIDENQDSIQCVVSKKDFMEHIIPLGKAQQPELMDYADHIDTMKFLREI
ncbi:MAG: acyl-CoA reductase [Flavobacteriales bacterium]|nr:MAG: acyl-CoA reductase [Flavobacteriales bacterium]